ncbi:MAG: ATP-dependent zinc protease [Gammaproteobacteria bacterium]|nr:ATP-dependent zinc protease [Gammaproteobacteria bacterium]
MVISFVRQALICARNGLLIRPPFRAVLLAALALTGVPAQAADEVPTVKPRRQILGWLESVRLMPWDERVRAKLDTGAKSNSIHAIDIERFERDGKEMVRFKLGFSHGSDDNPTVSVERPLVREVAIKMRPGDAADEGEGVDERPAVKLSFCMAGRRYQEVFTLADRSNFNYSVLLGRDFLAEKILVDPGRTFTRKASCPVAKK